MRPNIKTKNFFQSKRKVACEGLAKGSRARFEALVLNICFFLLFFCVIFWCVFAVVP